MTTPTVITTTGAKKRLAGWAAIASGFIGIIAFASLFVYLATQETAFQATGVMPLVGSALLATSDLGSALQAVLLIPAASALDALGRQNAPRLSPAAFAVGVFALLAVAVFRVLTFVNPAVPGILFMAPMGFVGLWLIAVNAIARRALSWGLWIVGVVAGVGYAIVGASFFFLGGLVVLTEGPEAITSDVDFHIGIAIGGFPAGILFPVWAVLLGRKLLTLTDGD
jgi:hypothetical protein